jgi:hypothetical protein
MTYRQAAVRQFSGPATGWKTDRTLFWQPGQAGFVASLRDFGVSAEVRIEWVVDVGYSLDASCQGPLYGGRDRSQGKVRVDTNRRPEIVEARRELVSSEHDDVQPFVATGL